MCTCVLRQERRNVQGFVLSVNFFITESPTETGARPVTSKTQRSPCSSSPQCWGRSYEKGQAVHVYTFKCACNGSNLGSHACAASTLIFSPIFPEVNNLKKKKPLKFHPNCIYILLMTATF